jgi:streptogramin lyase
MRALAFPVVAVLLAAPAAGMPANYPKLPPIPPGPPATTTVLPAPVSLPEGTTRTIALPDATAQSPQQTLVATSGAVWTSSGPYRIDARTGRVAGPFGGGAWHDLAFAAGSIWVTDFDGGVVRRLDPATGRTQAVVRLAAGSAPAGVAGAAGFVWIATEHDGTLVRIDPRTNRVVGRIALVPPGTRGPRAVAAGLGSIWVGAPGAQAVFRIDPRTSRIAAVVRFPLAMAPCGSIAVGTKAVWVGGCYEGSRIGRIDPARNRVVAVLEVAGETAQLRAAGGSVWLAESANADRNPVSTLLRLGPDNRAAARYSLPEDFVAGGIAMFSGSLWLGDLTHPRMLRVRLP